MSVDAETCLFRYIVTETKDHLFKFTASIQIQVSNVTGGNMDKLIYAYL